MVVEGVADAIIFDDWGRPIKEIAMSVPGPRGDFFYRIPEGIFHTLRFRSEWFVFLETTIGPFSTDSSENAPWAPPDSQPDAGRDFLSGLSWI